MTPAVRAVSGDPVGVVLAAVAERTPGAVVVDVGGGSGTRAVPLALRGCRVTVVDSSIDALAILRRRAAEAGVADRVEAVQADADRLATVVASGLADLVLCHHLLEEVEDPDAAVAAVVAALKPGGVASVLVSGRFAAVLDQAIAGRFSEAAAVLADPEGRFGPADPLRRRYDVAGLDALLTRHGLLVDSVVGIGVVTGPAITAARQATATGEGQLAQLEHDLSGHPVLREIAADLHAMARSPLATG